jgi:hypothetical protein
MEGGALAEVDHIAQGGALALNIAQDGKGLLVEGEGAVEVAAGDQHVRHLRGGWRSCLEHRPGVP